MKTTILGGVLFLAPLAIVTILLTKVFQLSLIVVSPIDKAIPVESFVGVATVNILAILLILVVCYLAGLLASKAFLGKRMQRLDGLLADLLPPYAVFKAVIASASSGEALSSQMKPVLARFDDCEQIAFEIESGPEKAVVFLPGAPSAWSGTVVVVEAARVRPLELPTHQAVKLMRTFGRGALVASRAALQGDGATESNAQVS